MEYRYPASIEDSQNPPYLAICPLLQLGREYLGTWYLPSSQDGTGAAGRMDISYLGTYEQDGTRVRTVRVLRVQVLAIYTRIYISSTSILLPL